MVALTFELYLVIKAFRYFSLSLILTFFEMLQHVVFLAISKIKSILKK